MEREEFEHCGPSRDVINKFLISSRNEESLSEEKERELIKAFLHIELCYHGHGNVNLCHQLWHKLQPMTRRKSEQYDPDIAMYFAQARMYNQPRSIWPRHEPQE